MAFSVQFATGDGTAQSFDLAFPYIEQDDVTITVDGVSAAFTYTTDTRVKLTNVAASGSVIVITRTTDIETAVVDYNDGSTLTEEDLDTQNKQLLYAMQEARDGVGNVASDSAAVSASEASASAAAAAASEANALQSETNAGTSAVASAASAAAAAASQASLNLPTIGAGDAGKVLNVNAGETAYELDDLVGVPTGVITMYANSSVPSGGWLQCNGSDVSRTTYSDLFAICGTTFGVGDGSTTFTLPDMRSRVPVGRGDGGANLTNRTVGATGGTEDETLTTSQMPSHSHSHSLAAATASFSAPGTGIYSAVGGAGSEPVATKQNFNGATEIILDASALDHTHGITGSINSAGSGNSHNNMPPFLGVNFIIKT